MSGICGLWRLDGRRLERETIEGMTDILAHRGRDGRGVWHRDRLGLGHRMLWTTPESLSERLPRMNVREDLAITAEARIDNREELFESLGIPRGPEAVSDSALILAAYERWGERCPEHLVGDFAFALWDGRRQCLFCARDHFGVKPFYYHHGPGRLFAFGSEIKAVLYLPEVPRRLNEARMAEYLVPVLLREDKASTFYEEVYRLPPAHFMRVDGRGVECCSYWSLDAGKEIRLASDEAYAEAFRAIFTESVRCRLRSAYPIGSMLSGGLDSSSIVCVARRLLVETGREALHTFNARFDAKECDERPYVEAVVGEGGLCAHYLEGDQIDPLADSRRVLWHQDEVFFVPNLFMHGALYAEAQAQGVRIVLDGFDGDTTVSHGVAYLTELAQDGRWPAALKEIAALCRNTGASRWRVLWQHAVKPAVPEPLRGFLRSLRRPAQVPRAALINTEFARRVSLAARIEGARTRSVNGMRTSRLDHWRGLTDALLPYCLEVADRAGNAYSIKPAFPFFDKRLAEFCLALPPEQKLREGWTRLVLRHAMQGILPSKVQWRPGKSDYSPVLAQALLRYNRRVLERACVEDSETIEAYMDRSGLRAVCHRFIRRPTPEDALRVWSAVALADWLSEGFKGPKAGPQAELTN